MDWGLTPEIVGVIAQMGGLGLFSSFVAYELHCLRVAHDQQAVSLARLLERLEHR